MVHIAYADIDATIIVEFRGVLALSREEAEKAAIAEFHEIVSLRQYTTSSIADEDIKIYWERKPPRGDKFQFEGGGIAIYKLRSSNRSPTTLP